MKIGDLVKLVAARFPDEWRGAAGVITEQQSHDMWIVLATNRANGAPAEIIIHEDDVKVVGIELSDEHLECIVGGMSPQKFSEWRASLVNDKNW